MKRTSLGFRISAFASFGRISTPRRVCSSANTVRNVWTAGLIFGGGPDILEWQLPFSVVEALLVDHSTGGSIRWCTADYEKLFGKGLGFGENEEIKAELLVDKNHPVIRPRFIKCREEQRQRSVEKAEVFTPSLVCDKQNNLVDL